LVIGVTGTVDNLSTTGSPDYAAALVAATGVISAGTVNIVTATISSVHYVFADTNNDNVIDTVLSLTGTAPVSGDFVA
jgi:hypothetical protein